MATVNMSLDILDTLNDIYNKKELAAEVENLLGNLKVSPHYNNGFRRLEVREYSKDPNNIHGENGRVVNAAVVPNELIDRLVECARDYYREKLNLFESFTVTGDILVEEE